MSSTGSVAVALGMLALLLGVTLLGIGFVRLLLSRRRRARQFAVWLNAAGTAAVVLAVVLLHGGEGRGGGTLSSAIVLIIAGVAVSTLGAWTGLWGPLAQRNTNAALLLIAVGIGAVLVGILLITMSPSSWTMPGAPPLAWGALPGVPGGLTRRIGPVSFGGFAAAVVFVTNGLAVKRRLGLQQILGANIVVGACLVAAYLFLAGR